MKSESWLDYAVSSNFPYLSGGNVVLYPQSHEIFVAGRNVRLSRTHLQFLTVLLSNFCETVSCQRLMNSGDRPLTSAENNLLKVQMFYLRRVLRHHNAGLEIRNVYGHGYQLRPL